METFDNTSVSSSLSRQRYKVAMTARARQRRMRRMKEKQENATTTLSGGKQHKRTDSNSTKNQLTKNIAPSKPSPPLSPDRHVDKKLTRGNKSRHEHGFHSRQREQRASGNNCTTTINPHPQTRGSVIETLLPSIAQPSLSAQEVRDATNFTSVQFCLSSEGQVEMLSDAGTNDVEDDRMEKQVFMNELWNTRRLMKEGSLLDNKSVSKNREFLIPENLCMAGELVE